MAITREANTARSPRAARDVGGRAARTAALCRRARGTCRRRRPLLARRAGALVAAAASIALTVGGVRARDSRTVLLGAAFSTMTALLAIHGIATPGVLVGPNGVIALAGGASLPAGADRARAQRAARDAPAREPRARCSRCRRASPSRSSGSGRSALLVPAPSRACRQARQRPGGRAARASAPPASPCSPARAARTYTLTRRTTDLLVERRLRLARLGARPAAADGLGTWAFYFGHASSCWASCWSRSPPCSTCATAAPRGRSSATSPPPSSSAPRRRSSARACAR